MSEANSNGRWISWAWLGRALVGGLTAVSLSVSAWALTSAVEVRTEAAVQRERVDGLKREVELLRVAVTTSGVAAEAALERNRAENREEFKDLKRLIESLRRP